MSYQPIIMTEKKVLANLISMLAEEILDEIGDTRAGRDALNKVADRADRRLISVNRALRKHLGYPAKHKHGAEETVERLRRKQDKLYTTRSRADKRTMRPEAFDRLVSVIESLDADDLFELSQALKDRYRRKAMQSADDLNDLGYATREFMKRGPERDRARKIIARKYNQRRKGIMRSYPKDTPH